MPATAHIDNTQTPGRLVRETAGLFHELLDGTAITTTANTGWLDKGFVYDCVLHLEFASVVGAGSAIIKLEQADDASGTNIEELATTLTIDEADDNTEVVRSICVDRRYVRVTTTVTGTLSVPVTATLRLAKDHRNTGNYSNQPA